MKFEPQSSKYLHLENEYNIYKSIGNHIGIPRLKWFGQEHDQRVLVLSLLGPSLENIFVGSGCRFKLRTVLAIVSQMVCFICFYFCILIFSTQLFHLEFIHSRHIIHCDIKPENILVGRGSSNRFVHLIDFGFARWFRDPRTFIHIPHQKNQPLVGTACYASMNALLGIRLTRRDDLESLAYVLIYLMQGSLPWQSRKSTELLDMRMAITPSTLCEGLPAEFEIFLNYARSLDFKQKPDYQYLRGLFSCLQESDHDNLLPIFEEPHPKPVKTPKRRDQVPVPPTTRK